MGDSNLRKKTRVRGHRMPDEVTSLPERLLGLSTVAEVSWATLEVALELTQGDCGWAGRLDTQAGEFVASASRPPGAMPDEELRRDPWLREPRVGRTVTPDGAAVVWTVAVPVLVGDAVAGRVALARRSRDFSPPELAALRRLAEIYALALRRASFAERIGAVDGLDASLFDSHPDGVAIIADGSFVRVSPAFAQLLGRPPEAILGHHPTEFVVAEDHGPTRSRMATAQGGTRERPSEYRIVRPDGSILSAEAVTRVIVWEGRPAFLIVFRDITRRKAVDEELRRRERILRVIAEFDEVIPSLSTEKVLRSALGFLRRKAGVVRLNVVSVDPAGRWATVVATEGDPDMGPPTGARFRLAGTLTGQALTSGQPEYVADYAARWGASELGRMMMGGGMRSALVVPLVSGGVCAGMLNAGSREPDGIDADTRELLTLLAPRLSAALENSKLYEELQSSESRFRTLFETAPVSLWEEDFTELKAALDHLRSEGVDDVERYLASHPDFGAVAAGMIRIADVNEYTLKLYKARSKEELLGALPRVFTEETYPVFAKAVGALFHGGGFVEHEAFNRTLEGDRLSVIVRAQIPEVGGELGRVPVCITDLTERKAIEEELRERAALDNLLATMSANLLNLEAEHTERGVREALGSLAGFAGADRAFLLVLARGGSEIIEILEWASWTDEDTLSEWVVHREVVFPWFIGVLGAGEPILLRRLSEMPPEGAREREFLASRGVKSAALVPVLSKGEQVGLLGIHALGEERDWSANVAGLMKIAGELFVTALGRMRAELELRQARETLEQSVRQRTSDLEQAKRELEEDIAARRRAEQEKTNLERELRQSRVLEAVGQLAGGVAHDFNNILGSVIGCLYAAKLQAGDEAALREELERAQALCKRGGELTRQLLTVARRRPGRPEPLDVAGLLDEARILLERTLPKTISLTIEREQGLPAVRADRSMFTAALLNLGLNARDAMPRGGALRVSAARESARDGRQWVVVEVSDTGVGIPVALQDRVFDPFFTTKAPGEGTGLGLSVVEAVVRECGGLVSLRSQPGVGTTFGLRFPAQGTPATERGAAGAARHPYTTSPVLIVEDEEDVARMIVQILEAHGYATLRATTGVEALERVRDHRGGLGLVVLDLILPELGGEEVYRLLKGLAPEVSVLLITGREDKARSLAPGAPLLPKPFTPEELLASVAELLKRNRRRS